MPLLSEASSTSSERGVSAVRGSTTPRLFTPPLVEGPPGECGCGCALSSATSYGFDVAWFAEHVLGRPLDPWQRWAAIHGGELLPDGRPRFRKLLIIVARQQGKTYLCQVLTLFWLFVERWPMTLGTSTNLGYAKESWQAAVSLAESTPELAAELPANAVRKAAGEECLTTAHGARYKIAASNRKGGRSLSIDRLVLDELREHADWSAWGAAYNAMSARPYGQVVAITNQGDATSVVLDSLRADALARIESGGGDERLGLLEWSAPPGSDPEDVAALAQANPNLGHRTTADDLLSDARRAKRNGGEELTTFKTEIMCVRVNKLDPAIDLDIWENRCAVPGSLDDMRDRVAMVLDLSPDLRHAVLYAAAMLADGRVRVDFVKAWEGQGSTGQVRRDLPGVLARTKPRKFGWLPDGPAAALTADLAAQATEGRADWPPEGVEVAPIKGETPAVCMGFADLVDAGQVLHSNDPLLNAQVKGAEWLPRGNLRVFSRRGAGHVNAVYAAAGAAHLARMLPPADDYDPLGNIY